MGVDMGQSVAINFLMKRGNFFTVLLSNFSNEKLTILSELLMDCIFYWIKNSQKILTKNTSLNSQPNLTLMMPEDCPSQQHKSPQIKLHKSLIAFFSSQNQQS